ncbi:MAG: MarR family transcriptional regulator [Betaproteobacteria bacterium]|nr:MarR family transcriptional regulator [Betaproteobacteria bacterium]
MAESPLHSLLLCLSRALQHEQRQAALGGGLLPVQWAILAYLRDANRYSNTPQALAEYLSLTKGTVSQSLKLMESHGWITRSGDASDRRIVRLALSEAGRAHLAPAAEEAWLAAIAALPAPDQVTAEHALRRLLAGWQHIRQGRTFGVCRSCRHFHPGSPEHRCGLTGEALSDEDSTRLCREHELALPAP